MARRFTTASSTLAFVALLVALGCDGGGTAPVEDGGTPPPPTDGGTPPPTDGGMDTDAGGDDEAEVTMGRLLVAHATEPTVWVWDLDGETPSLAGTLSVSGPATLYGDVYGRYGYAVQGGDDITHVIDQGLLIESHGDHFHVDRDPPRLHSTTLTGVEPTYFTQNQGWSAIFYDGTGAVDLVFDRSLSTATPIVRQLGARVAHHGLAIPAFGHLLASIAAPPAEGETARPTQIGIWEVDALEGPPESSEGPCTGLHGQAAAGEWALFGCADGVLAIEYHDDHFEDAVMIANPAGTPEGTRVGTLRAHGEAFVGNWGTDGLVRIDPATRTFGTPVTLPARHRGFVFDRNGEYLVVLTIDGNLHRLRPDLTTSGAPLSVTAAFEANANPRPQLTVGADRIYVTDPASSRVREIHLHEWEIERDITLPAAPRSAVVLSVSPDYEDHHHGHEH